MTEIDFASRSSVRMRIMLGRSGLAGAAKASGSPSTAAPRARLTNRTKGLLAQEGVVVLLLSDGGIIRSCSPSLFFTLLRLAFAPLLPPMPRSHATRAADLTRTYVRTKMTLGWG